MSAIISQCGRYRYSLERPAEVFPEKREPAFFVMLNPSTADAEKDDATIRRCKGFAKSWKRNGIIVANLYAFRATNPKDLWASEDPVGELTNAYLQYFANCYKNVVCAWGAHAKQDRVDEVMRIFKHAGARTWCLGTTKSGAPRHPLYVKSDQALMPWPAGEQ